jgi:hypothetical protein
MRDCGEQVRPKPARHVPRLVSETDQRPLARPVSNLLVNASASTLNQNAQHNRKKDASHNPNDGYVFHVESPFSLVEKFLK